MFFHFWNYAASVLITYKRVGKRSRTFIIVITQSHTFSLNLGTSNKNFEATKYFPGKFFQKEQEYQIKKNRKFPEKYCVLSFIAWFYFLVFAWKFCLFPWCYFVLPLIIYHSLFEMCLSLIFCQFIPIFFGSTFGNYSVLHLFLYCFYEV